MKSSPKYFRRPCRALLPLGFALLVAATPSALLAQHPPPEAPDAANAAASSKEHANADPSGQRLLQEAASIAQKVGDFRGLGLQAEIHKGLRNRDQLRAVLIQRLAEELSDEEVENEAKVFKKLELLPADLDYRQTLLDVLTEQIAGFYDQRAKELYVMEGIPLDLQRPAMAHEIFHAIQDQHFNIQRMVEPLSARENADFALARSAFIEGDASMVMIDFSLYEQGVLPHGNIGSVIDIPMMANVLRQLTRQDIGALQQLLPDDTAAQTPVDPNAVARTALGEAPRMLQKMLTFPYFAGMEFIIEARKGHDWARVDAIYDNAPVSSEQILHPQRYFDGDEPILLDFDTAPVMSGEALIYDTTLGEYQMRLYLEEHLLVDAAEGKSSAAIERTIDRAMLGWGGDRLRAFEPAPGQTVLTHLSVWDSQLDAAEYFDALVQTTQRRFAQAEASQMQGRYGRALCLLTPAGERIYVEQWGDLVLHMEGLPSQIDPSARETDPSAWMLREQIMHTVKRSHFGAEYRKKLDAYDAQHGPRD